MLVCIVRSQTFSECRCSLYTDKCMWYVLTFSLQALHSVNLCILFRSCTDQFFICTYQFVAMNVCSNYHGLYTQHRLVIAACKSLTTCQTFARSIMHQSSTLPLQ